MLVATIKTDRGDIRLELFREQVEGDLLENGAVAEAFGNLLCRKERDGHGSFCPVPLVAR